MPLSPPESPAVPPDDRRFRDLLDRIPLMVFEMDLDGRLTYVNRGALEVFGYTAEDFGRGVTIVQVLVPSDRERAAQNIRRRLAGEMDEVAEYTALRRDGSTFPVAIQAAPVLQEGRATRLQGYLVDLTPQRRAENVLRFRVEFEQLIMGLSTHLIGLSHDELDAGIDSALAALGKFLGVDRSYVFRLRPDGAHVDNTHEWAAEGVTREREQLQSVPASTLKWFLGELRQRRVLEIPDTAALPPDADWERQEFAREGIRSLIAVAMHHRGKLVGFLGLDSVRAARGWSEDESALLRVVGELFVGALTRRDAEAALRESEARYRALIETTGTGFLVADAQGRVVDANPEYVRMTGHASLAAIVGRPMRDWTADRDRERTAAEVRRLAQGGSVRNLLVDYVRPDGTSVPVEISATLIEVSGQRLILALTRDISERKRLQDQLTQAEKLRSVGVLAGGIAHDFNNILTALLGNVSLLRHTVGREVAHAERLAESEQAIFRARDLTRQLLTFSRGGAPVRKVVQPANLIREATVLALRGRSTASELRLAPDLRLVDVDEGQLGQVISNLVLNASQAMAGGGTVVVEAANRDLPQDNGLGLPEGRYVAVTVRDRGSGIPEEHLPRIFEPYFTTKQEGSGLGLAVCYSIIANHGGRIEVSSTPGAGSTFALFLPASSAMQADVAPAVPEPLRGSGRILVMDDEKSVRSTAQMILASLGYQVATAVDGREAIARWTAARAEGRPFDAAIMDLTVPGGVGGADALRELLRLDPAARAIVSSGYNQDPIMSQYRQYGFLDALAKPYNVVELSRVLARVLTDRER